MLDEFAALKHMNANELQPLASIDELLECSCILVLYPLKELHASGPQLVVVKHLE